MKKEKNIVIKETRVTLLSIVIYVLIWNLISFEWAVCAGISQIVAILTIKKS